MLISDWVPNRYYISGGDKQLVEVFDTRDNIMMSMVKFSKYWLKTGYGLPVVVSRTKGAFEFEIRNGCWRPITENQFTFVWNFWKSDNY